MALLGASLSFGACGESHHHHDDEATHEHEGTHEHEHEADEEHNHQGEHEHADSHEGHDHGHEKAGSSDEIVISQKKAKAAGIKSLKLQAEDFSEVIEVSGRIENAQGSEATLVASASGTVHLNQVLTEGSSVNAGATLMSISTQSVTHSDPYEQAKITYQAAEQEYLRVQKLLDNQLISQNRYTEAKERYESAKLALSSVGRNYNGGTQAINSPISGYVQQCLVKNGDYVEIGQPLAVVSANKRLFLKADVPEKYYASLSLI
ncbi:MAG: efflux RND transporter periplasmic adaptor subunit, partial [Bacteroidaceae bacterium]|nr:efflux RND transporter periplasmic adaptor subunit [Bacteroidaceae bacterium]